MNKTLKEFLVVISENFIHVSPRIPRSEDPAKPDSKKVRVNDIPRKIKFATPENLKEYSFNGSKEKFDELRTVTQRFYDAYNDFLGGARKLLLYGHVPPSN